MKKIVVTGAAGSIGSELVRQLNASFDDVDILCVDSNENGLFELGNELLYSRNKLTMIPANVSEDTWLNDARFENVTDIFHAAAFKHVPLSEANAEYYFQNNVGGMINVIKLANKGNVRLTLISTDKAVEPNNVMGYTKRACEFLMLDQKNDNYKIVRFGNVLNSNGSVLPIFKKQISEGGPVTVTSPTVSRYFMSINEAVYLVLFAATDENSANINVLNMGAEIRIDTFARNLIEQSGFRVVEYGRKKNKDEIEIKYTGLRAGEKEREVLTYGNLIGTGRVLKVDEDCNPTIELINLINDCIYNKIPFKFDTVDWARGCLLN